MKDLIEILSWCRGAHTNSEKQFVKEHIATIDGIWPDEYGNYHLTLGANPRILWSCHTDTVTRKEGRQNVRWLGKGILGLQNGKSGMCLGADDGGGVWIMKQMIAAGKPGHYVFHRDEEIGGLGSTWISNNPYVLPDTIQAAIAMDRAGTKDIITHQMWQRGCSDTFARSLGKMLPDGMVGDDSGVFTDTANYFDLIGECTNLSIGYEHNHGPEETLDTNHLRRLRDALMELDVNKLEFEREPGEVEYGGYSSQSWYPGTAQSFHDDIPWDNDNDGYEPMNLQKAEKDIMSYHDMVGLEPDIAARLLSELGVTREEFRAHVFALRGRILGE